MSQAGETFFTSVGCMDGRSECTIAKWGREKFGVKFADAITEAGLVGLLPQNPNQALLDSLKKKISISVQKHHSENIVVSGHEDCAGNPVDEVTHKEDVKKSVEIIKKLIDNIVPVCGVFVKRAGQEWIAEEL